jgi:hypothetical protein
MSSGSKSHKAQKARKVIDVPLTCKCGNTDWREFRYRSENHDFDGKPRRLLGICSECGQEHVLAEGQWNLDQTNGRTGKFIVLFSPSPHSFYRVCEFADFEKARKWCEGIAAAPSQLLYVKLMVCEAVESRALTTIARCRAAKHNKACRYMVLWKDMEPCYHLMLEFDQFQDAIEYATATTIRLQALKDSTQYSHHGLPETLRLLAFTTVGEWNVANKPRG